MKFFSNEKRKYPFHPITIQFGFQVRQSGERDRIFMELPSEG